MVPYFANFEDVIRHAAIRESGQSWRTLTPPHSSLIRGITLRIDAGMLMPLPSVAALKYGVEMRLDTIEILQPGLMFFTYGVSELFVFIETRTERHQKSNGRVDLVC